MQKQTRKNQSKVLNATLYCYVESPNAKHAKRVGKNLFGSFSAYVNALIARDRGVKPRLGMWKAKGEADKARAVKRKNKRRH